MSIYALQRKNMVESQVRPSDVVDRRILRAMLDIPREAFVPEDARPLAYIDREVRISPRAEPLARYLLAPSVHARLIQFLEPDEHTVVLDVGCGTGYGSAVLARLAQTVVGLEADPGLADQASRTLSALSVDNVVIITGSLTAGWPDEGPYDAILLNGSVPEVPAALLNQLKDGGRLAGILAGGGVSKATLWQRSGPHFASRALFDAAAAPLPGFERRAQFVF
ncbi:MAG: protein-L-isoaspartate O-methyltransferase [Hyphomicrobiaceae bacterium]|nr:protein-L-isoaspartate O-methyltransferase [Hyphomicrobiaceae bacterium]